MEPTLRRSDQKNKKELKKQKIKNLPKWRKFIRFTRKTIAYSLFTGILLAAGALGYVWKEYGPTVQGAVTEGFAISKQFDKNVFIQRQPTVVYDKDNNIIKELKETASEYVAYEDINPYFKNGIVAVEDKRFYLHQGVDLYGTARSMVSTYVSGDTQGGSTLTQQLVRNVILNNNEVSVNRKLKEQVVSQELEKMLSKEEIVQHYLNNVFFGNGNYGIAPASNFYFGKDQSELSAGEVAIIIGITNNPALFDPIKQEESALNKRNRVLKTMLDNGVIDKQVYDVETEKAIELNITSHNLNNDLSDNDLLEYTIHKATEDLMEASGFVFSYVFNTEEERLRYKERHAEVYDMYRKKILSGGYEIHTSVDMKKQKELEDYVEKKLAPYNAKTEHGLYRTQIAMTTIDNKTGEVTAIIGGRGEEGDYLNRAYQSPRQPGSTMKPLISYAPAFEMGYAPQSKVVDSEIKNGPRNVYRGYWGEMTARYALEMSVNTVAYKLANQVGSKTFMDKLERMEFSYLTENDHNPIITLGGLTYGVTTVEMASGYSTLTRHGRFIEPTNVVAIKDIITKEILVEKDKKPRQVYQEDAAYFTIDTLKGVMTDGTGKNAQIPNYSHSFGKTGTTNDVKDSYFVGGTPYYTTAIWVGYDMPATITPYERALPMEIFSDWNEKLHKGLKVIDFEMPKSVTKSGDKLYSSLETYKDKQRKRQQQEDTRLQQERAKQRERLELEDYRIVHNLTTEEELKRESATEKAIAEARNFLMASVEDYDVWMELIEEAKKQNEKVKHKRAYERYRIEISEIEIRATVEKDRLLAEIKKQEEEERKREEAFLREQAEIEQLQQSLSGYLSQVEAGKTLTEAEFVTLESIILRLKEKGVETPQIHVEWIEEDLPEEIIEEVEEDEELEEDSQEEEAFEEQEDIENIDEDAEGE